MTIQSSWKDGRLLYKIAREMTIQMRNDNTKQLGRPGIWSQEPPTPGGVSYLLGSLIKYPEKEDLPRSTWYKFFEGGPLPPDSWLRTLAHRKPTPGGGFSSDQTTQQTNYRDERLQYKIARGIMYCAQWLERFTIRNI